MYVIKNICHGVVHVHMTAGVQLPTKIIQEWENPSRDIVFYILHNVPKCIWMKKMQANLWKQERKIFALRISKKLDSKPSGKQDLLLTEKRRDIKRPPTTVSAQDCMHITCSLDAQTTKNYLQWTDLQNHLNFPKRNRNAQHQLKKPRECQDRFSNNRGNSRSTRVIFQKQKHNNDI